MVHSFSNKLIYRTAVALLAVLFLFIFSSKYSFAREIHTVNTGSSPVLNFISQDSPPPQGGSETEEKNVKPATKFLIKKIQVNGNKVLSDKDFASIASLYEGKEITLDDLKKAAKLIQDKYKEKGYFLAIAYVPAQEINNGVAFINILEGRLGEVKVEGNNYYPASFIQKYFNPAEQYGVIRYEDFQRSLLLLNELPDIKVQSVLKPGKEYGTTDVILKVTDRRPFHIGIDYNNFGTTFTGENRAGLNISGGGLLWEGDYLFLRGVYAFPARSGTPFYQASYSFPSARHGTKVAVTYATAEMKVGRELTILDIRGTAQIYGITVSRPLHRTINETSDLSFSFFSKDFSNYILGTPYSRDALRMISTGYNAGWDSRNARNFLSINVTQGLGSSLGGMKNNDPLSSRPGADNSFTKFNLDLVRLQKVGSSQFLIIRGSGQLAANPLVTGEEFYIGGADTVRGYPQSELLGDSGYYISAEYRIPVSEWKERKLQAAFFLDQGSVNLKSPATGGASEKSLTGGGVGIRLGIGEKTSLRLDWGFPFSRENSVHQPSIIYVQFLTSF